MDESADFHRLQDQPWTFIGPYLALLSRDGILRKRREHARGRNLADYGSICTSVGLIEEMWNKCS